MKKLIKTAKQQFDERLSKLALLKKYALSETDLYYLCENEERDMSILREIHGKEFYEQRYNCSYSQLINHEEFLQQMTMRFIEHHEVSIKPLFDWYASADKTDEPFTLDDIWMCNLEDEDLSVVFSDIYEEVPDACILTAKEQWETDSVNAETIANNKEYVLKVQVDPSFVKFFRHDDSVACYTYPSLEKLRIDRDFIASAIECLMESSQSELVSPFLKWTRIGGEFPIPLSVIFHSECQGYTCKVYEDKKIEPIEERYFITEISNLKERMIAYIEELYEKGLRVNSEHFIGNTYAIIWDDGSYYNCANIRSVYFR